MTPHSFSPTRLLFGGDYNPEQWSSQVWDRDAELMAEAGVTAVSLGIFGWATHETAEGRIAVEWLEPILDRLGGAGVDVVLATPSGALPRWLTEKHPDTRTVDERRVLRPHGERHRICPASAGLRDHVGRINTALAQRFGNDSRVVAWHISNEVQPQCWCDGCAEMFRQWLRARYDNDIDRLNDGYWSRFWSHRYFSFDQIEPPYPDAGIVPNALVLDWHRWRFEAMADFVRFELETLRRAGALQPATTNLMYSCRVLNNPQMADVVDFVSWDSYPQPTSDPMRESPAHAAFRGLKAGTPWLLIEQSVSSTNIWEFARLKPPGRYRLEAWQAVAHGSEGAMCFQWRASRGGYEKFHAAMLPHSGTKARTWREVCRVGREMRLASPLIAGTRPPRAQVALLDDPESEWAYRFSCGPGWDKPWFELFLDHAVGFVRAGVPFDVVRPDVDWSGYQLLVTPVLYALRTATHPVNTDGTDLGHRIRDFVEAGGTLVTTFLSAYADESDLVFEGGPPGPLRDVLGFTIDELDHHPAGEAPNSIKLIGESPWDGLELPCEEYFELPIAEGAEVLAAYTRGWYAEHPAILRHRFGDGIAYHIATRLDPSGWDHIVRCLAQSHGLASLLLHADEGLEATVREGDDGRRVLFVLNHRDKPARGSLPEGTWQDVFSGVFRDGEIQLDGFDVRVFTRHIP